MTDFADPAEYLEHNFQDHQVLSRQIFPFDVKAPKVLTFKKLRYKLETTVNALEESSRGEAIERDNKTEPTPPRGGGILRILGDQIKTQNNPWMKNSPQKYPMLNL